jgi:DNA-directed RNA polymerase subunit H (RpoH/RPB5)
LGEDEFLLNFPSEDLRNELTKFKGFEFATAIVKAKVEPTNLEEDVCALEETWVKATSFPRKAKKEMVIKEISHLVGDPVEVDKKSASRNHLLSSKFD